MAINLNAVQPEFDGIRPFETNYRDEKIEAFSADLASRLIERLRKADMVCGCMAWLTHRDVLGALAEVSGGCQVVVQKEDFIRPGVVGKGELQRMYRALSGPGDGYSLPSPGCGLNTCGDACEEVDPIRCMGIANPDPREVVPRMHHKFFVFCKYERTDPFHRRIVVPYAVWTGSFNATQNATNSRENAIYIENDSLAQFYANEWARVYAVSEPLDWHFNFVDSDSAKRFGS